MPSNNSKAHQNETANDHQSLAVVTPVGAFYVTLPSPNWIRCLVWESVPQHPIETARFGVYSPGHWGRQSGIAFGSSP